MRKPLILLLSILLNTLHAQTSILKTVNGVNFTMISVKGGNFQMGSKELYWTKPVHPVSVPDFALGETEVTQELWVAVMGENPSNFSDCPKCPAEQVSWNDAQRFLTKLNALTGENYRLPSEAEWEFAARGGTKSKGYMYSGSNKLNSIAWYSENGNSKTHPVKTKSANEIGLFDMSGNVWEWCADSWHPSYEDAPADGQAWTWGDSESKVLRGGSWFYGEVVTHLAYRFWSEPDHYNYDIGFRLALSRH